MTYQIAKSRVAALGYDFEAEVQKHIQALEEHRFEGNAAPHSYAEVEAAIRRVQYPIKDEKPDDFVADYEIVNDDPPPRLPPTLAERKALAIGELREKERAEISALIPPEAVRLTAMKAQRAMRLPEDQRSPADDKLIADYQALQDQLEDIRFRYAEQEAALADMT